MKPIKIKIEGEAIGFFGKVKGANTNKFNRATKLAVVFEELDVKLCGIITRGGTSLHSRMALAVRLLMHTGIRVGNESSAEGYTTKPHPNSKKEPEFVKTFGLTTLRYEHITVKGNRVYLNFVGKKQIENSFVLSSDLAKQVRELLKAQNEDGTLFGCSAYEITKFIHTYVGKQFSPKDFRTMKANIEAWSMLSTISSRPTPNTKREFNLEVREIAEHVSTCLNNTIGVCKKSYIDDQLFTYHLEKRWL